MFRISKYIKATTDVLCIVNVHFCLVRFWQPKTGAQKPPQGTWWSFSKVWTTSAEPCCSSLEHRFWDLVQTYESSVSRAVAFLMTLPMTWCASESLFHAISQPRNSASPSLPDLSQPSPRAPWNHNPPSRDLGILVYVFLYSEKLGSCAFWLIHNVQKPDTDPSWIGTTSGRPFLNYTFIVCYLDAGTNSMLEMWPFPVPKDTPHFPFESLHHLEHLVQTLPGPLDKHKTEAERG